MKKMPKISIFLSYYNDTKFLRSAIDAILNQDFQDFELILLNHATTDDCREIAHSYRDSRIVHIDKDFNYGAGCGLLIQDMLAVARGKYVKFCCADDILHPDCLTELSNYMENHPNCDCVCADMDFINLNGKKINYKKRIAKDCFNNLLKVFIDGDNCICYPTVMVKKDVLKNIFIDKSFIMFLDVSLWVELLCAGYNIERMDKKLVSYRIHNNQASKVFGNVSFVEMVGFANIFYKISDVKLIKQVCDDVEYSKQLTQKDKKYFPFIIALHLLNGANLSFAIAGYLKIHELMNDDKMRGDIEQRFGFNVAEFRKLYKELPALQGFLNTEYKKMRFGKLLKLIGRRIFRVLTPKFYRNCFYKIKGMIK